MRRTLTVALTVAAIVALVVPTASAQLHRPAVTELETNAAVAPLGIDDPSPRLSWTLESDRRGVTQIGFRVLVATSPDLLRRGRADVWDSGLVRSSDPAVVYEGPPLEPQTTYWWTVQVLGRGAGHTGWAPPARFETGLLDTGWEGEWIAGPERITTRLTPEQGEADDAEVTADDEFCRPPEWPTVPLMSFVEQNQGDCREIRPVPFLRTTFEVDQPVASARLYASGLAYNDMSLNGEPTSDAVLDPGFTDYDETVQYTTHDVTDLLRQGENVLATALGSGQYDSSTRTWDWGWDLAEWRAEPRVRAELHVTYADGSTEIVATDGSWQMTDEGPWRYDSYYLGETYDARREIPGWRETGFDASGWDDARVVEAPDGEVRAQVQEPIRVVDVREPASRTEPVEGIQVYDVGQNLTGWARITVDAPEGTPIEVFYTEKLDEAGLASTEGNALVGGQLQTDYYVAAGTGDETFTPRFTYKGFRYVQVSGPEGAPLPEGVTVTVDAIEQVRTDLESTSSFDSGNGTLDRIHDNTWWAYQNNAHGVITDTPVYEKNAWTGDASLMAGTAATLFDMRRLYTKMFQDMLDAQTAEGEVPHLSPSNENYGYVGQPAFKDPDCCGATPAWDSFWFTVPWEHYLRYGDISSLETVYPAMTQYLDEWVPQWTDDDGDDLDHTLTAGLGDWVPPEEVEVEPPTMNHLVSTAYYAYVVEIAADAARALGNEADAARYDALWEEIRADFNAAFLGDDGIYRDEPDDQLFHTAQILPLAFDLVPDDLRDDVARRLADDIMAKGGNAHVGVIGARWVLPVLTATGHHDVAYTFATQTDYPSWGYWTDTLGFTALGEHWEADTRSRNHHFFGPIVQWFYEDLVGVRPLAPGYAEIEFAPEIPDGLDHAEMTYDSVRGTVASAWRRVDGGIEVDVTVPTNATGIVRLPAGDQRDVTEVGGRRPLPARVARGVRFVGSEDGRVVYEVGSGSYTFRIAD